MKLDNKVCPCCGKPLKLIAPIRKYFPDVMGVSLNGVEFALRNDSRISSYTRKPMAEKLNSMHNMFIGIAESRRISENSITHFPENGNRKSNPLYPVVPIRFIERKIRQGGRHLYNRWLFFQCGECRCRLAVNSTPLRLLSIFTDGPIALWIAFLTIVGIMVYTEYLPFPWVIWTAVSLPIIEACYGLYIALSTLYLGRNASNFAPIDGSDNLVKLPEMLTVTRDEIPKRLCRETNVLSADFGGETWQLYITAVSSDSLGVYVCGSAEEQNRLLEALRNSKSRSFNLRFEGRSAGRAGVTYIGRVPENLTRKEEEQSDEWQCSCRYLNSALDAQCRSCGKYR